MDAKWIFFGIGNSLLIVGFWRIVCGLWSSSWTKCSGVIEKIAFNQHASSRGGNIGTSAKILYKYKNDKKGLFSKIRG